jgi:HSP20 family protein
MPSHESLYKELAWLPTDEGQLSVDVLEDTCHLYVRTAIAGTHLEDLDISVTHDTVTIRGKRTPPGHGPCEQATQHIGECYWGAFSRSIVMPSRVHPEASNAVLQNGILTITLPKAETSSTIDVTEVPPYD